MPLLTRAEAEQYLRLPVGWLRRHVHDGPPRIAYPGGRVLRYAPADLDAWIVSRREYACGITSSDAEPSTTPACGARAAVNGSGAPRESVHARQLREWLQQSPLESAPPRLHAVPGPAIDGQPHGNASRGPDREPERHEDRGVTGPAIVLQVIALLPDSLARSVWILAHSWQGAVQLDTATTMAMQRKDNPRQRIS